MRRRLVGVTLAIAAALAVCRARAGGEGSAERLPGQADRREQAASWRAAGYDLTEGDHGKYIEIYATGRQARGAARRRRRARSRSPASGGARGARRTTTPAATPPATSGRATTRSPATARSSTWSSTTASPPSRSSRRSSLGTDAPGPRHRAVKVTKDADTDARQLASPAVLYNAQQHAREWLAGETCRRTLDFFVDNYGSTGTALDTTATRSRASPPSRSRSSSTRASCGSCCISNPDGYEYTFTAGQPAVAQEHGRQRRRRHPRRGRATASTRTATSPPTGAATTRAPRTTRPRRPTAAPGRHSEPETKAMKSLWDRVDFVVPEERPHRGRAAAVSAGLPAVHADARQRHLRGAGRRRRRLGDRRQDVRRGRAGRPGRRLVARSRATASTRTSAPSSTSPTATRSTTRTTRTASSASRPRAREPARRERLGLRVPGRRGRHRGRVPAPPAVLARPRALGRRPGQPDLAPRQHGRGLLRRDLRRLLRRPADASR